MLFTVTLLVIVIVIVTVTVTVTVTVMMLDRSVTCDVPVMRMIGPGPTLTNDISRVKVLCIHSDRHYKQPSCSGKGY
jgi:hypothetical protein